jgi:hypothetical protein
MSTRVGIICAIVAAGLVAIYLEFVRDFRTPRVEFVVAGVVGFNQQVPTERYIAISESMKAKYGEEAETWIGPNGTATKVKGQVVATEKIEGRFLDAIGMTVAGGQGKNTPFGIFPFRIGPNAVPEPVAARTLALTIRERFQSVLVPDALDFTDRDFVIEGCRNLSAAELGLKIAGPLLGLGRTTLCTVIWKRTKPARMLIGITIAEGGFWIRPFNRGVCRTLAQAWLRNVSQSDHSRLPDFVQCMLADRPASRSDAVSTQVYQVGADGTLAVGPETSRVVPFAAHFTYTSVKSPS